MINGGYVPDPKKPFHTIIDFITGKPTPDIGAEQNRQAVERFLVNVKGFEKKDIEVDPDIAITVGGEPYQSQVDLVVIVNGIRF